jgi:hypothetical protein
LNGHSRSQRLVLAVVCGVFPAALLVVLVAVPAAMWPRLPGRIADHWNLTGAVNGSAPRMVPFLLMGGLALIGAAMLWAGVTGRGSARRPQAKTRLITTGLFVTALATAISVRVTVANVGVSDWRQASIGLSGIGSLIGPPVVLTATASYLLRRYGGLGAIDDGSARSSLGLRATERAVWTGRARATWPVLTGTVLLACAVLLGLAAQWGLTAVLLVAGVAMFGFTSVRVTVAARGVTVAYGPLGLRLTRFPLRRIERAEAVNRTAFSFGYRGSLTVFGSAAVALRRGPALSLTLRDHKTFVVTVDDAATGAALLNDLIAADQAPAGVPD